MEELKKMLNRKYPNINFEHEKHLIDDGVLDSIELVSIIAEIEKLYDISVTIEYIQPIYFQSVEDMWAMIEELL